MADLLALVCHIYCDVVTFPFGILGPVWYLIVSIPDPCCLFFTLSVNKVLLYITLGKLCYVRNMKDILLDFSLNVKRRLMNA